MGQLVGLLELAKDFRLAEHHRVDAARHAEEVVDALRFKVRVQRMTGSRGNAVKVAQELFQRLAKHGITLPCRGINLHAVAGGEDHGLVGDAALVHLAKRVGNLCIGKGKSLP